MGAMMDRSTAVPMGCVAMVPMWPAAMDVTTAHGGAVIGIGKERHAKAGTAPRLERSSARSGVLCLAIGAGGKTPDQKRERRYERDGRQDAEADRIRIGIGGQAEVRQQDDDQQRPGTEA